MLHFSQCVTLELLDQAYFTLTHALSCQARLLSYCYNRQEVSTDRNGAMLKDKLLTLRQFLFRRCHKWRKS